MHRKALSVFSFSQVSQERCQRSETRITSYSILPSLDGDRVPLSKLFSETGDDAK